ncbi:Fe uptake system permease [Parafrankia sp. EAN1pec]|nr:Fe uptake system permease [Frankia sp. EAN1pec]
MPQGSPGAFSLTVTEAVMLGRTPHSRLRPSPEDERRVHEAIDLLDLTALADRHVDELSGGQAQRAIHDLNLAARFCRQVALLHKGRIITSGTPADVYAADLIETVYGLTVDVDLRDGTPEVRPALPGPRPPALPGGQRRSTLKIEHQPPGS